jgi:hypothetical protein
MRLLAAIIFRSLGGGGGGGAGFGIRDLGGRFDLQGFERAAALLIGRLKHEEKRISEKAIFCCEMEIT